MSHPEWIHEAAQCLRRCAGTISEQRAEIERLRAAVKQMIAYTRQCSEPDGWLAVNVRCEGESSLSHQQGMEEK